MMGCAIVVNEETRETCRKRAVQSVELPLDPYGDDAAGRERRLMIVRFCEDHWEQRQQFASNRRMQLFRVPEAGNEVADGMTSGGARLPRLPQGFQMGRLEYLLSEAPHYLREAFNAGCIIPIEAMLTNGMTLKGVSYWIYRDAAAREQAKANGIEALDQVKAENPSEPADPDNPPAEERPAEFCGHEIVPELARRLNLDRVSWWPLLLLETQAQILEHLIDLQETYAVRPTAAQMVDAALALADNGAATSEQFDLMLEAMRSKLR